MARKYFIKGRGEFTGHVPTEASDPVEEGSELVVGPNCKQCVLAVRDVDGIEHCLRYHQDIAKFDHSEFDHTMQKFMLTHNCKVGTYRLMQ